MNKALGAIASVVLWIRRDYREHPVRFLLEVIAWAISIGCNLVFALTVPHVPFLALYPLWVIGAAIYGWAAWTRGSFGMMANYSLLMIIDSSGLVRLLNI